MKRFLIMGIVVLMALLALSGCQYLKGDDGTAQIQVSIEDPTYNSLLYDMDEFSSLTLDTYYDIDAGDYTGSYVLYYSTYSYSTYKYTTQFNTGYYVTSSSISTNVDTYCDYYYSEGYHNDFTYTIDVNKGSYLFKDGSDLYYTLYLAWNPDNSSIDSSTSKAVVMEDTPGKVVKELKDGACTIRMEMPKKTWNGEWKELLPKE